ncbi:MAG TPA: DUF393 domain-containing protein [Verrucomicrobiae bacterium]|jgi:predicted DCC family thiol-disulfide oxidoreductase YuxK|nr:DUF393 domain-containing protein [Verrucomicrobiae bacterium]
MKAHPLNLFKKLGLRLYREPLVLIYDAYCKLCRRTVAALRVVDVFARIDYISAQDKPQLQSHGLGHLNEQALMKDIHGVIAGRVWRGYEAYRKVAQRVPLLWPLVPFLYLPPVEALGKKIYRRIADSRTCSIPEPKDRLSGHSGKREEKPAGPD